MSNPVPSAFRGYRVNIVDAVLYAWRSSYGNSSVWVVERAPDPKSQFEHFGWNIYAYSGYNPDKNTAAIFQSGYQVGDLDKARAWLIDGKWIAVLGSKSVFPVKYPTERTRWMVIDDPNGPGQQVRWLPTRPPAYVRRFVIRRLNLPKGVVI
jgi:hypothetical protein